MPYQVSFGLLDFYNVMITIDKERVRFLDLCALGGGEGQDSRPSRCDGGHKRGEDHCWQSSIADLPLLFFSSSRHATRRVKVVQKWVPLLLIPEGLMLGNKSTTMMLHSPITDLLLFLLVVIEVGCERSRGELWRW